MLEGDKKCHWYFWGFSTPETAYFECHDTRSGDVALSLLSESKCEYLVSDVFSGYNKAVIDTNVFRKAQGLPIVESIYCNAHAQRKFTEARDILEVLMAKAKTEEERAGLESEYAKVNFYVKGYKEIYRLWYEAKGRPPDEILKFKEEEMKPHYKRLQGQAMKDLGGYSEKSAFGKALRYFVKTMKALRDF